VINLPQPERKLVDDIIKREQLPDDHPLVWRYGRRYGTIYALLLKGENDE